jgi:hypothetical protein
MAIKKWDARISEAHPDSDPLHWPPDLILKHITAELADLRSRHQGKPMLNWLRARFGVKQKNVSNPLQLSDEHVAEITRRVAALIPVQEEPASVPAVRQSDKAIRPVKRES